MTTDTQSGVTVETASGPVFLPDGVPSWVSDNLIASAGGLIEQVAQPPAITTSPGVNVTDAPAAAVAANVQTSGQFVTTNTRPVWIPDGAPDWLVVSLIEQAGGLAFGADPPRSTSPGVAGGVQKPPAKTPPPTTTTTPKPSPAPTPKPSPGAVPPQSFPAAVVDALKAAADAARRLAGAAANKAGSAASQVGDLLNAIKTGATDAIMKLVPTVSELALGLTHRFADLAGFIGNNLMEAGEFAGTLADSLASGMSVAFDDAWRWLFDALSWLGQLLVSPLQARLDEWFAEIVSEAI